jgi:hypothetical protein
MLKLGIIGSHNESRLRRKNANYEAMEHSLVDTEWYCAALANRESLSNARMVMILYVGISDSGGFFRMDGGHVFHHLRCGYI